MIFEICVDSVAGVRAAKAAGADRVELCADLLEGGITPSRGMIRQARTIAGVGLNVMIRPRGGDFLFDDDEFATMRSDIETAKAEGADGVVIGLLSAAGEIDIARTRELIALARPLSVTFHRAFDMTPEPFRALEDADRTRRGSRADLGPGGERSRRPAAHCRTHRARRRPHRRHAGRRNHASATSTESSLRPRPREIHFAALEPIASGMRFRRPHVFMGGELRPPEYDRLDTSAASVRAVIAGASR